jgi:hypothetical protein
VGLTERAGRLAVFGLIIAGMTLCLVRDPGTGDVAFSISWITRMPPAGPFAGYGLIVPVHDLGVNYPPLSILALWASLRLGAIAGLSEVLSYKTGVALFTVVSVLLVLRRERSVERAGLLFVLTAPGANQTCAIKPRVFVIGSGGYDLRQRAGWRRGRPNSPASRR